MQTLLDSGWQGASCAAIATHFAGIVLAPAYAIMVIGGMIMWVRGAAKLPSGAWPIYGVSVLVLPVIVFALVTGEKTHRVLVSQTGMVFEGCRAFTPFSEAVRFEDIERVGHRTARGAARSPNAHDDLVVTLRGTGAPRIIPLSTDPAVLDPALLRRLVPAEVIEAWRESLTQRGGRLPAGY